MHIVGQEEIDALASVIQSKALFRYGIGEQCERFEERYSAYLDVGHFTLAASGSNALAAALTAVGIGPGDEVLIPAHTFMATATSVLTAGAIPVIVDIDESLTIDPSAVEAAIGPRTRALIPVHMWGAACDMDAIMSVAQKRDLIVVEDACQGVGGGYKGRKFGSIGKAGAFSFNYYKNMTAGEGGGVASSDQEVAEKVRCAIDPCSYLWNGSSDFLPFSSNGARASELMGAMLNVQLDRLDGMIAAMRSEREQVREAARSLHNFGLKESLTHSPDGDCSTHLFLSLPSAEAAEKFALECSAVVAANTGRHTYTYWDHVLQGQGAAHPAMNPYLMPANEHCRKAYSKDMCARSLEILGRTVLIAMSPSHTQGDIDRMIEDIARAARSVA